MTHALEPLEARWLPTLMLTLQEAGVNDGAPAIVSTAPDFTAASFTGTFGNFSVKGFGGVSDNDASLSDLLSSATSVRNVGTQTATLYLTVYQSDYTLPTGSPLTIESGLGGSMNVGTRLGLANIFQAYASSANNTTPNYTNGPQSAVQKGSSFVTGSADGSFDPPSSPYAMWSTVAINLNAGGAANFSTSVTSTDPTGAGVVGSSDVNKTIDIGIIPIDLQSTTTLSNATPTIGAKHPHSS